MSKWRIYVKYANNEAMWIWMYADSIEKKTEDSYILDGKIDVVYKGCSILKVERL